MKKLKEFKENISTKQAFVGGLVGVVALVVLGFLFINFNLYRALPVSVANVNGERISLKQYNQEYNGYKFFMSNNNDQVFDEERAKNDVLSRLMINSIIDELLKKYRGEITDQEVTDILPSIFAERTEEEFFTTVKQTYGWDRDDFIERVVRPSLAQDELIKFITQDEEVTSQFGTGEKEFNASHIFISKSDDKKDSETKKILGDVLTKIAAGENFEDFASTMNNDLSIESKGEIGWFALRDVDPSFGAEVERLENGEISKNIIESEFGFHIIKRNDMRNKTDIDAYIQEQIKQAKVKVYWGLPNPLEITESLE